MELCRSLKPLADSTSFADSTMSPSLQEIGSILEAPLTYFSTGEYIASIHMHWSFLRTQVKGDLLDAY